MSNFDILKNQINALIAQKDFLIIAIDGGCTSGKTTLANKLKDVYNCNVFHLDDFFLRPEQKTEERLNEVGGNVDYERFKSEVLVPLSKKSNFTYRPYLCNLKNFGEPINVKMKSINIIEGSYSLHPYLRDFYDFKVFIEIDKELQSTRVLKRDKNLHQRFFEEWIPKEQKYFDEKNIKNCCDIVLSATE